MPRKKTPGVLNARQVECQAEENHGLPIEARPGTKIPESLDEMIKRMVRTELSGQADQEDNDTFEEADDFAEEDPEVIPLTHHEVVAMDQEELRDAATSMGYEIQEEAPQEVAPDQPAPTGPGDEAPAPAQAPSPKEPQETGAQESAAPEGRQQTFGRISTPT